MKTRKGKFITEKEEVEERWLEHVRGLYNEQRDELVDVSVNNEEPPKLENDEVRNAIEQGRARRAHGPDNMTREMITRLGYISIEKAKTY